MSVAVGDDHIPVRVSVWNVLLSSIFRCSFDKWFENHVRLSEIIVNDIHEQRSIEERFDELQSRRTRVVEARPLLTKFVCLVLPCHKADCFNDRGLHDLLSREHTPRHGIRTFRVGIRAEVAGFVDNVVSDIYVLFNAREEESQQFGRNEEFEVCLEGNQLQRRETTE